ncbi:MAG: GEVED domain-containing protein, partial [Phycisphaerae bacterium]
PKGLAEDGEVEDHEVFIEESAEKLDWGDAPDAVGASWYPTLAIHNGANHAIVAGGPILGNLVDSDPDGQPNSYATGDDIDPDGDDEDGVIIPPLYAGHTRMAQVTVQAGPAGRAVVEAWFDWNRDQTWDASELVYSNLLATGTYPIPVTPPAGTGAGDTFARFRISTLGTGSPEGPASDGEVEDYTVTIYQPEIDAFPNTWGQLTIEREVPDGSKIIVICHLELRGFSQWEVFIGPDGQAADTDGDRLDQVETEIVEMDLAGDSWMGPLTVNLHSSSPAPGEMEEMENNRPGILDVQPFASEGFVESFFDITYQFKPAEFKDQKQQILHTEVPLRYRAVISHKPPRAGESYVAIPGQSVELLDENGQPVGVRIIGGVYVPDPVWDFGDAPDDGSGLGYPTLAVNNGACHVITADGPWLGDASDAPDSDPDGQPHPNALGDDTFDLNDDEDGVSIPVLTQGAQTWIACGVSNVMPGGAYVDGWIDWNGDNTWDASEKVLTAGPLGDGVYTVAVTPPAGSVVGQTFARFRINSRGNLLPTGGAVDGEVEDYEVRILEGVPENTKWV